MADALQINEMLTLPASTLSWTAVRGSGPGGQNVNKVASKVELRFALEASPLTEDVKARLRKRATAAGEILIVAGTHRDQGRNLADAYERLRAMVAAALQRPKPRKKTRPSKRANERRLQSKRVNAERKAARRL